MSRTGRAIDKALHAPHTLTPAEREFTRGLRPAWEDFEPGDAPDDAGSPGAPAPAALRPLSDAWEPPTEDEAAALRHHESLVDPSE